MIRIERPRIDSPLRDAHKYSRGLVVVIQGAMPGAAMLAARAAMHGGAGYVVLAGRDPMAGGPDALVRRRIDDLTDLLADDRVGAVVIGPGLGEAHNWIEAAWASDRPLVLDGDALTPSLPTAPSRAPATILTPHAGEFDRLFGPGNDRKHRRTAAAAQATGAVIVHKGADTVVAAPDGGVAHKSDAPSWLATAGTGDILAGLIGARLATGLTPFAAAAEAVWLQARAAELAGPAFIADDLVPAIPRALAECLTA